MQINLWRLSGPRQEELHWEDEADLWTAPAHSNRHPSNPCDQLVQVSPGLPQDVLDELLAVLNRGLDAVRDEAIEAEREVYAGGRKMPAMALTVLAWLQAAERALADRTPQELRVLVALSRVGGQE